MEVKHLIVYTILDVSSSAASTWIDPVPGTSLIDSYEGTVISSCVLPNLLDGRKGQGLCLSESVVFVSHSC